MHTIQPPTTQSTLGGHDSFRTPRPLLFSERCRICHSLHRTIALLEMVRRLGVKCGQKKIVCTSILVLTYNVCTCTCMYLCIYYIRMNFAQMRHCNISPLHQLCMYVCMYVCSLCMYVYNIIKALAAQMSHHSNELLSHTRYSFCCYWR